MYDTIKAELKKKPVWILMVMEILTYTIVILFIIIWSPLLLNFNPNANVGFAFLTFTFSIIIFSKLFEIQILILKNNIYQHFCYVLLAQSFCLLYSYFTQIFIFKLICNAIVNGSFGFLLPCLSTMKSQIITESIRTLMMSVFKVPTYTLSLITLLISILITPEKVNF